MSTTAVDAAISFAADAGDPVVRLGGGAGDGGGGFGQRHLQMVSGRGTAERGELVALARAGRVSVEWLATGAETAQGAQAIARAVERGDYVFMPRNRIRFSKGRDGVLRSDQVVD